MDKKFGKIREFHHKHPRITSAAAGMIVGGVVVAKLMHHPSKTYHFDLTMDQAKKLMEDPKSCVVFDVPVLKDIFHVNVPQK